MRFMLVTSFLALAALAQAYVNGPCTNGGNLEGICITTSACANYGGTSNPGSPGAPTCPGTPNNVQCCTIFTRCPGLGTDTLCTWNNRCTGTWNGVILPNPICPGGNDFVCCDING